MKKNTICWYALIIDGPRKIWKYKGWSYREKTTIGEIRNWLRSGNKVRIDGRTYDMCTFSSRVTV
jgi:hypothetical protein